MLVPLARKLRIVPGHSPRYNAKKLPFSLITKCILCSTGMFLLLKKKKFLIFSGKCVQSDHDNGVCSSLGQWGVNELIDILKYLGIPNYYFNGKMY
jgi:hypothetical protein